MGGWESAACRPIQLVVGVVAAVVVLAAVVVGGRVRLGSRDSPGEW